MRGESGAVVGGGRIKSCTCIFSRRSPSSSLPSTYFFFRIALSCCSEISYTPERQTCGYRPENSDKTDLVHHVVIAGLHLCDRPASGLLNGHHVLERLLVVHEVHRDTLPAKPARTSYRGSNQLQFEKVARGGFHTYPVDVRFDVRNEVQPVVNPRFLLPLAHHR